MACNKVLLLALVIFTTQVLAGVEAGAFNQELGLGRWVSVDDNGDMWAVSVDKQVYHRSGASGWNKLPGRVPANLAQISAGRAGVWVVSRDGDIFVRDNNDWLQVPGTMRRISSGSEVWGVSFENQVYRYQGGGRWELIPGSLVDISVSENGEVWGVDSGGNVLRISGGIWVPIPGTLSSVAVGRAGVWGLHNGQVYNLNENSGSFELVGARRQLAQIDSGYVVTGLSEDGSVWTWVP